MESSSARKCSGVFIGVSAVLGFLLLFLQTAGAQQLTQAWVNRFDGAAHGPDVAYAIAADTNDNSYVTGETCAQLPFNTATSSCQQTDLAVVKYDINGNTVWTNTVPARGNLSAGTAVTTDGSGNVYVAGFGQTGQLASDGTPIIEFITVKYDPSGVQQWIAYFQGGGTDYGGPNPQDGPAGIAVDASGNVWISGFVSNGPTASGSMATIKYNASGQQLWAETLNPTAVVSTYTTAMPRGLAIDNQDDVYVTGSVGNGAFGQGVTIEYDANGNQVWSQTFGPVQQTDQLGQPYFNTGIILDAKSNAYVTAYGGGLYTGQLFQPQTAYVIKYSSTGTQLWVGQHLTSGAYGNLTAALAIDESGNVYTAGTVADTQPTASSPTDFDTLKFDANGNFVWEERYNGNGNGTDSATGIALDTAGNVYVTGQSTSPGAAAGQDYATVEYDANGDQISVSRYNGPANGNDIPVGIAIGSTTAFVSGTSLTPNGDSDPNSSDWATIALQPMNSAVTAEAAHGPTSVSISPNSLTFPNQADGTASAAQKITVTNIGGRTVTIGDIALTGTNAKDFSLGNITCADSLAPGSTCSMTVEFAPVEIGNLTAAVSIPGNAPGGPQSVSLSGTGTGPEVSLSPASVTFPLQAVGTTSATQTVTLKNSGNAALTINSITITGTNAGDFKPVNITCEASLAANASCTITIAFAPTAPGNRSASVTITDNAPESPQSVPLTGTTPDFTLSAATGGSNTATITAGQTASYNLQLAPSSLTGTVTLGCAGAPAQATCSVSPTSLNITGSSPAAFTVSVATTARPAGSLVIVGMLRSILWLAIVTLALFAIFATSRTEIRLRPALALAGLLMIISLAGCGSTVTGAIPPSTTPSASGTPAGTSTITVTATAGQLIHTMTLSLTVN